MIDFIYTDKPSGGIIQIPIGLLVHHPDNPRKDLGDLSELTESIKARGVLQNLTVVPAREQGGTGVYYVVIGNRRLEASKAAGLEFLPCVISDMPYAEQLSTMLLENMQRVDLTPFEQAQGFQMMINFGESVESIAEKTGFSKKTVKRRLKMAELDQDVLKEVSGRQLSLDDFDRLAQVEDIGKRNELLRDIGTNNFDMRVSAQIKKQKIAKAMPLVQFAIKQIHANKIHYSETYGGKYVFILEAKISAFESAFEIPEKYKNEKLYYYLDEGWDLVKIYVQAPKAKPVKRTKAEIEREKKIEGAHAALNELCSEAYKLRREFIKKFRFTVDLTDKMLDGAILACLVEQYSYNSHINKADIYKEICGAEFDDNDYSAANRLKAIRDAYAGNKRRAAVGIIYLSFGDTASQIFHSTYKGEYPRHSPNRPLELLYTWLCSIGYQMSDDERMMMDGTHPLFEEG